MMKLKKILIENVIFTPDEKNFIEKIKSGEVEIDSSSDELLDKFYMFFNEKMPYGTMKARTGDPLDWLMQHIDEIPTQTNESSKSQDKRYVVTFEMDMYAINDADIKKQAADFVFKLDQKYDNRAKVIEIHENEFGQVGGRVVK